MAFVEIPEYLKCMRCGHRWIPRGSKDPAKGKVEVRCCPKCKSPYWDRQKQEGGK